MPVTDSNDYWIPIIAQSLALLALQGSGINKQPLAQQAQYLKRLGLENKDLAELLNIKENSLRALLSQASKVKSTNKSTSNKRGEQNGSH